MNWRTSTVIAICEGMRQSQDYTACPILADALQDADCPDENTLAALRGPLAVWEAERLVALAYSDESASAVKWLEKFAVDVGYTYETVANAGREFIASGEPYRDIEGYTWDASNAMADNKVREKYWDCYELLTGTRVELHHREDKAFECPC